MKSSGCYVYPVLSQVGIRSAAVTLFWTMMVAVTLGAERKQTIASVEPLYRAYRFGSNPSLNPATTFNIRELEVPNLWAVLRLQLFAVDDVVGDHAFAWRQFLCRGGVVYAFVESFGGQGVMSAIVHANALYYSYSWGSGIHRSLVGRLTIHGDLPVRQESDPLFNVDMFVESDAGRRVRVVTGRWREFNRWEEGQFLGWIDVSEETRLKIVDELGSDALLWRSVTACGSATGPRVGMAGPVTDETIRPEVLAVALATLIKADPSTKAEDVSLKTYVLARSRDVKGALIYDFEALVSIKRTRPGFLSDPSNREPVLVRGKIGFRLNGTEWVHVPVK